MRVARTPRRALAIARLAALALALAIVAAACGPAASAPSPAPVATASAAVRTAAPASVAPTPSAAPVPLSIGIALNIVNAPLMVGVEKGLFLKNGIDAKLVTAPAGNAAMTALVAGQYQVISTAWATVAPAVQQGTPLKLIGLVSGGPVANYDNQLALVTRPGLTATTINDLKGKKIASVLGTTPEIWLKTRLRNAGMNPDTDVSIANVAYANMLGVLQTGAADAAVPVEPYGALITSSLPGSKVMVRGGGIVDGHQLFVATPTWIAQNGALLDKLITALYESTQYARQHPDETATASSHFIDGITIPVLTAGLKEILYDPRWSDSVAQGFVRTSQQLVDAGLLKAGLDVPGILATDVLNASVTKNAQFTADLR